MAKAAAKVKAKAKAKKPAAKKPAKKAAKRRSRAGAWFGAGLGWALGQGSEPPPLSSASRVQESRNRNAVSGFLSFKVRLMICESLRNRK